jgi:hypothetical protein
MQIVREYTYAFGAVSPHDGALVSLILPVVTAVAMSIFLAEVAQRHPKDFILMVLDGAGWHRASTLVVPENMRLLPCLLTVHNLTPPSISGMKCGKNGLPTQSLMPLMAWKTASKSLWYTWNKTKV